ncbi:branched-chain amino acid transport system II carrier protein [Eudoraea chungangensis]|uniref:branched-chain amino acid transport system II carrier protein n=1 Tax=Eudoraea chungangensis TaxID=1481905 RepID=UPI0023EB596D|nr:branched-chain amino acid transport system II carrier protein [Eudoraea chungangensis]
MNKTKELFIISFALFSLFFGAGNLILPPYLGLKSGALWWLVTIGFCLSAVVVPILGVQAYSKLQGTMYDFGKKVSPLFSLVYSFIIYAIAITLPSPRTASVTHEIAIAPLFDSSPLNTSIVYFGLVFLFVINRSKILGIIGKWLTPGILLILLLIIGKSIFFDSTIIGGNSFLNPLTEGVLEGYQTFDGIGAIVVGGVIIVSVNLRFKEESFEEKRDIISKAGWIAGLGLLLVYTGLIFSGATFQSMFDTTISRSNLLKSISSFTLGTNASLFLSILVSLACFTTCVGIITGTADYFQSRLPRYNKVYFVTAFMSCALGLLIGQLDVAKIIQVAIPILIIVYPVTIVLILLNIIPSKFNSDFVFKVVVYTTIIFSIPDLLNSLGYGEEFNYLTSWIPFTSLSIGWLVPALVSFVISNFLERYWLKNV